VPRSLTSDLLRIVTAALAGTALLATFATVRIWQIGSRDDRGQPVDAVVVLGAAQYDGRPSPVFAARLDHAISLVLDDVAPILVVTGGKAPGDRVSEAEAARAYAISRGVPDGAILGETSGTDTLSSLRNVARMLHSRGERRAIFVSDPTHMLRVLTIARDLGIDAAGSPTRSSPVGRDLVSWLDAVRHELAGLALYHFAGR
jgi:uncharacterized SAM-binding protein YcdF (DUF218 family)